MKSVKHEILKEQWKELIKNYNESGLPVRQWCEKNQISRHAYYYWLRKIRMNACESMLPAIPEQNKSIAFAKVELQAHQSAPSTAITIHLSGATLEVRDGASQQTIEYLLLALKKIC